MHRRHSAPTSVVVLQPQLVEVNAVVGLCDAGVRNMLEAVADLETLPVEAITHTHVRTEQIRSAQVAVSDRGARQDMGRRRLPRTDPRVRSAEGETPA